MIPRTSRPAAARGGAVALFVWIGMLIASDLPSIVQPMTPWSRESMLAGQVASLMLAGLTARAVARPAAAFLWLMLAYRVGWSVVLPALHGSAWWQQWWMQPNSNARQVVVAAVPLLVPLSMAVIALLLRVRVGPLCRWGDWRQPVATTWPTWGSVFVGYNVFALSWLAAGVWLGWQSVDGGWGRVANLLPAIVVAAAVNAGREELEYRVLPLTALDTAVGPVQAIAVTSLLFGLSHWHGTPSGPAGVFTTAMGGAVFAGSVLGTRGVGWAVVAHWFGDLVLYTALIHHRGVFRIS